MVCIVILDRYASLTASQTSILCYTCMAMAAGLAVPYSGFCGYWVCVCWSAAMDIGNRCATIHTAEHAATALLCVLKPLSDVYRHL